MKLRTRLFIGLTVIAIAFGVTGFLVTGTQRRYQTSQVDRQLQIVPGVGLQRCEHLLLVAELAMHAIQPIPGRGKARIQLHSLPVSRKRTRWLTGLREGLTQKERHHG